MTQHHDPVHPDEGDLESPDDAYVAALLADLPAVVMPTEVAARLDAALAALGPLAADDPAASEEPETIAAPTVVPISAAPSHPSRWQHPRVLQAAAGLVLVLAAGAVGIKALHGSSPSSAGSTAAAPASAPQALTPITRSSHAYSAASLATDVRTLVSGKLSNSSFSAPTSVPNNQVSSPGPTGGTGVSAGTAQPGGGPPKAVSPELQRLAASATSLAPCVALIEDGLPVAVAPIAVDAGTYDGQPALIVVLPGADDPTSYDVWIVGPTCGKNNDAALIRYQSVPRT